MGLRKTHERSACLSYNAQARPSDGETESESEEEIRSRGEHSKSKLLVSSPPVLNSFASSAIRIHSPMKILDEHFHIVTVLFNY